MEEVTAGAGTGSVEFEQLDLASLANAKRFVRRLKRRPDLLVANAGIMAPETRMETSDGLEQQFQVKALELQLSAAPLGNVCRGLETLHRFWNLRSCFGSDTMVSLMNPPTNLCYQVNYLCHWLLAHELLLAPQRRPKQGSAGSRHGTGSLCVHVACSAFQSRNANIGASEISPLLGAGRHGCCGSRLSFIAVAS